MTPEKATIELIETSRRGRADDARKLLELGADPAHLCFAAARIAARHDHVEFLEAIVSHSGINPVLDALELNKDRIAIANFKKKFKP